MKFEYARISGSLFQQEYSLSRAQEYVEMAVYSIIAFSLPFLLGHEQLLVGSVVNCALVLAALNLKGARLLPVIILPSIGAYLAGLLFGVASPALLYTIPFIWMGNALLVLCIKYLALAGKKTNSMAVLGIGATAKLGIGATAKNMTALGIGATAKAAFLFLSAFALLTFGAVPAAFLAAMGIFQLATALLGGSAALALQMGKKRFATA